MAGIYIHIPYCRKACHYCNFHFSTSGQSENEFVTALLKEIRLQKDFTENELIGTIYFGGGTPSLLPSEHIQAIFKALNENFQIKATAEITLEANPDDIMPGKITEWRNAGINRLSIGIQSFYDRDLQWMNRAHSSQQAENAIMLAQQEGISNISADLIYGIPSLTDAEWEKNVHRIVAKGIPHISCYALTVEPKTVLGKMVTGKKIPDMDQEQQARQFILLMDWLNEAGYEHYEISNFAKPGMRSMHNSAYWNRTTYLGLGPSAHSFKGNTRMWNIANNALYIQALAKNTISFESETLTKEQQCNEMIMTAIRTCEGINAGILEQEFGKKAADKVLKQGAGYLERNLILLRDGHLILTKEGKLFADGIAAGLFVDELA